MVSVLHRTRHRSWVPSYDDNRLPVYSERRESSAYIVCYVDDLLSVEEKSVVRSVKQRPAKLYPVPVLQTCAELLGSEIILGKGVDILSQQALIAKSTAKSGMAAAEAANCLNLVGHVLHKKIKTASIGERSVKKHLSSRNILEWLLYTATRTRPDIATAVSMLAQYYDHPPTPH